MRTAIDTNVFSAVWDREPGSEHLVQLLGQEFQSGSLVVSGIVYAETLAHSRASEEFLANFFAETVVVIDFSMEEAVWVEAGRRYALYAQRRRRSSGQRPKRLLVDFLVGAHALLQADRLMTLDQERYRRDFPELMLVRLGSLGVSH